MPADSLFSSFGVASCGTEVGIVTTVVHSGRVWIDWLKSSYRLSIWEE